MLLKQYCHYRLRLLVRLILRPASVTPCDVREAFDFRLTGEPENIFSGFYEPSSMHHHFRTLTLRSRGRRHFHQVAVKTFFLVIVLALYAMLWHRLFFIVNVCGHHSVFFIVTGRVEYADILINLTLLKKGSIRHSTYVSGNTRACFYRHGNVNQNRTLLPLFDTITWSLKPHQE